MTFFLSTWHDIHYDESVFDANDPMTTMQGGKEGMMETDKNPEELYTEAKELLSLVMMMMMMTTMMVPLLHAHAWK